MTAQSDIITPRRVRSRAARRLLRHEWQPNNATAQTIEAAVPYLLSDPAQAALADRQTKSAQAKRIQSHLSPG